MVLPLHDLLAVPCLLIEFPGRGELSHQAKTERIVVRGSQGITIVSAETVPRTLVGDLVHFTCGTEISLCAEIGCDTVHGQQRLFVCCTQGFTHQLECAL